MATSTTLRVRQTDVTANNVLTMLVHTSTQFTISMAPTGSWPEAEEKWANDEWKSAPGRVAGLLGAVRN